MKSKTKKQKDHVLRVLSHSIREYKPSAILSIVFIILEVLMECILPLIMSKLIDQMNAETIVVSHIVWISIVLVIMAMLSLGFGALSGFYAAKSSAGFAKNLRKDMYLNITKFSFANIDKFEESSLVTRMTTDVTNVQMAYMMIIRTAFRSPLMIIFSIVMSFIMAPSLAWIFVVVMPILAVVLGYIVYLSTKIFRRIFKKYDDLNESIKENIDGIRVVKSFVREDYENKKFDKAADDLRRNFTHAERIIAWNTPAMQFSIYAINILLIILGSIAIVKHSTPVVDASGTMVGVNATGVTIGNFQSLMTYGMQSLMALMMLSMVIVMIVMAVESARRIYEVLIEKPTLANPENPIMEVKDGSIDFNNVSFKYSEKAEKFSLSNVDLHIKSGETIGIIGGTGSSKTSLINLVSRLYDTTEGEVLVGGVNVKDYDIEVLRNNVAVVLQKNMLFSGSIKENLRWGKEDATDEEIEEACKLACADSFIQEFNDKYDYHIEQGGSNVSGGQKQRLCIARALLKHPKILILDDSTSAVDTKTDAIIRKGLKEFIPSTTKIIIAQRISSIEEADRIIVMENGEINGIGTSEELLKNNDIYRELYEYQTKKSNKEEE